jgi:hypothetical protein
VKPPAGPQTLFVVTRSKLSGDFVNLNWFTLGATPTSAPTTSAPPPPNSGSGWVVMDQAKWKAQLAEFNAMKTKTVTGNPVRVSEFSASCEHSHSLADDPIVLPGGSHMHSFLGNDATDAFTTTGTLLKNAGSSCKPGSRLKDPTRTVPLPQGFSMVVGDAKRQVATPKGANGQFWCGGIGGEIGRSADGNWPICAKTADLTFHLTFPDCWDGVHLDSPDHKSHTGPADSSGVCSGKFPVAIPSIAFVIGYSTSGSSAGNF